MTKIYDEKPPNNATTYAAMGERTECSRHERRKTAMQSHKIVKLHNRETIAPVNYPGDTHNDGESTMTGWRKQLRPWHIWNDVKLDQHRTRDEGKFNEGWRKATGPGTFVKMEDNANTSQKSLLSKPD